MKKIQISENEMVDFIKANIDIVPDRSKDKFATYDLKKQYRKIKWYLKEQETKDKNVMVVRVERMFNAKNASIEDAKAVIEFCNEYINSAKEREIAAIDAEIAKLMQKKQSIA